MTTDYNPIAGQYQQSKRQPWRTHIESHSLWQAVGDVKGRSVVDLACGEGYYTRALKQRGADRVLGIDLSEGMIALARAQENQEPLEIEYRVGDARECAAHGEFDLAIAAYLLNYARIPDELAAMCRGVASQLRPGGRFVTVNSNPACRFGQRSYRKYGFETTTAGPLEEGSPVTWTFHLDGSTFSIENYFLDIAAHEGALHGAGFRRIRWHPVTVAPAARDEFPGFWDDFLQEPPIVVLECAL